MSGTYAAQTQVSVASSRAEIERLLMKYGAHAFASGWEGRMASIMFDLGDRRIRFTLPLPDKADQEFTRTPTGKRRAPAEAQRAYEQAQRQRWRALALIIKAKLEAIETGIATVDEEFLSWIVIPGSTTTIGEQIQPELRRAYEVNGYAPMLALTAKES